MDEKAREEKIRQKQADDDEYFMEFGMDSNFTNEIDPWEYSLDIDDSDLHLTPVMRSSSSAHVEPSPYTPNPVTIIPGHTGVHLSNSVCVEPSSSTPNPVRIIPGPASLVQRAKLLKENVFILDPDGALMSTQEYMRLMLWKRDKKGMLRLSSLLDDVLLKVSPGAASFRWTPRVPEKVKVLSHLAIINRCSKFSAS
ncbi:hypothetical protein Tco_0808856 [Tanacetum coccineum]